MIPEVTYYLENRPLSCEEVSGDIGGIEEFDNQVFFYLLDVAGHGKKANDVALICKDFLTANFRDKELCNLVCDLHQHILGSQGMVASLCSLALDSGELQHVGIGNITIRLVTTDLQGYSFVSMNGLIGCRLPRLREERTTLKRGELLVLHTDGISSRFRLKNYPELLAADVKTIATEIVRRFGTDTDDASCLVLRYG